MHPTCLADTVLYSNGSDLPTISWWSDVARNQFLADDFVLNDRANVTTIKWKGVYGSGLTNDSFEIRFLRDIDPGSGIDFEVVASVNPANVVRFDSGLDLPNGLSVYSYESDVSAEGIIFDANDRLWLNVINETSTSNWAWAGTESGRAVFSNDLNTWNTFSGNLDFRLIGNVVIPEPQSAGILIAMFMAIKLKRKR